MIPRNLQNAATQRDRWMASYVDVLTILLVFFLVGAAKSVEAPPARPIPLSPPKVAQTEPRRPTLVRAQERLREQGLDPKLEPRGLVISLPQVILFPSGQDKVSPQALPTLGHIADVLREVPNDVQLIGHTDTLPIHNGRFRSNWDLSTARSQQILDLLSHRYGIPESRLSFASYGPYRPAASNNTVDGRASNRRVEIVILDEPDPGAGRSTAPGPLPPPSQPAKQ